jgi:hypothetical protein
LDAVDHLTENQSPIAPTRPVYFAVVVEAGRAGFDADSFRQGLQEALVQDPDLLALGRRQGGFNDHARCIGVEPAVAGMRLTSNSVGVMPNTIQHRTRPSTWR